MSFKLFTTIFDANKVSPEEVVKKLLHSQREFVRQKLLENGSEGDPIPCVTGSWFIEMAKTHPSGMQMIFQRSAEPLARPYIPFDDLAYVLSTLFPDIPFFKLHYTSVVDTGSCIVYMNGEEVESYFGKDGDCGKFLNPVMKKYFSIKRNAFSVIREWIENVRSYGGYNISSYPHMQWILSKENCEEEFLYYFYSREIKGIEIFKENPNLTEQEWKEKYEQQCDLPYDEALNAYKAYVNEQNKTYSSTLYVMTDGNLFTRAWFFEEPQVVEPFEWFRMEEQGNQDYMRKKDEIFGKAPKSYRLTEEELRSLSYEEQKKEAYKRYAIAKKRNEVFTPKYYAMGIKPQCDYEVGDYIYFDKNYFVIQRIELVPNDEEETYIEQLAVVRYYHHTDLAQLRWIPKKEFDQVIHVSISEVPPECIVPEKYKHILQ